MTDGLALYGATDDILAKEIPLGRTGRVTDLAGISIYLASQASAWVTGAIIPVDGGHNIVPTSTGGAKL